MAYIKLSKTNFFHNLDAIVKQAGKKDRVAIVLKDNAYGHGLLEIAQLSREYGIKRAIVQSEVEAQQIADFFEYILVLADFPQQKTSNIHYTINSLETIKKFPKNTKVELKVDTGMHRNGIAMGELEVALNAIKEQNLELCGVFTHHRSADELTSEWFWQNQNFKKIKEQVKSFGFENILFHSANSASLFRYEKFDEDMVRVGIAAYGLLDLPKPLQKVELKPVLSLYAKKISQRTLQKGECIGYGATFCAKETMNVATYDIGYGDGFLRCLSNNYTTSKNEQLLGRISMDNSCFTTQKDEILVFNDARGVAKKAGTIAYEIVTSLKPSLQREIIEDIYNGK